MFQIEIEGFSGPLDLLCHMIDQNEIEVSQISVSEIISIYSAYLSASGTLPISSIAEFISQAAHLVRQKTFSLLPQYDASVAEDDEILIDEPDLASVLERYRPYREAAGVLAELKEKADRRHFRNEEEPEPFFDLGDLYSLSVQWLDLLKRRQSTPEIIDGGEEMTVDDGLPAEIPDEIQVENRMERLLERLSVFPEGMSLRSVLSDEPGRGPLVVTLLALLELSRKNLVTLIQKELFGDVFIRARNS